MEDRRVRVIEVACHAKGSAVLSDVENKFLFTEDNNNKKVWCFWKDSLTLEPYVETLNELNHRSTDFDTVFPGHGEPQEIDPADE